MLLAPLLLLVLLHQILVLLLEMCCWWGLHPWVLCLVEQSSCLMEQRWLSQSCWW
jgi:hypothetical protein